MKKNFLTNSIEQTKSSIKKQYILALIAVMVAIVANILLCVFRTDSTHKLFLTINIVLDVLVGWFVYGLLSIKTMPQKNRLKLAEKALTVGENIVGSVVDVTQQSQKVCKLNCKTLSVDIGIDRKIFVVENTLEKYLIVGKRLNMLVVDNILIELWEVDDE